MREYFTDTAAALTITITELAPVATITIAAIPRPARTQTPAQLPVRTILVPLQYPGFRQLIETPLQSFHQTAWPRGQEPVARQVPNPEAHNSRVSSLFPDTLEELIGRRPTRRDSGELAQNNDGEQGGHGSSSLRAALKWRCRGQDTIRSAVLPRARRQHPRFAGTPLGSSPRQRAKPEGPRPFRGSVHEHATGPQGPGTPRDGLDISCRVRILECPHGHACRCHHLSSRRRNSCRSWLKPTP